MKLKDLQSQWNDISEYGRENKLTDQQYSEKQELYIYAIGHGFELNKETNQWS